MSHFLNSFLLVLLLIPALVAEAGSISKLELHSLNLPEPVRNQYISLAVEDGAGMIWFVTNTGLHRFDGRDIISFDLQSAPALPGLSIQYLLPGKHNNLFIACGNDFLRFSLTNWQLEHLEFLDTHRRRVKSHLVTLCRQLRNGNVLIATKEGGLFLVDEQRGNICVALDGDTGHLMAAEAVSAITEADDRTIWLGTTTGRMLSLHPYKDRWQLSPAHTKRSLTQQSITFIHAVNDSIIVFRTGTSIYRQYARNGRQCQNLNLAFSHPIPRDAHIQPLTIGSELAFAVIDSLRLSLSHYSFPHGFVLKRELDHLNAIHSGILKVADAKDDHLLLLTDDGMKLLKNKQRMFDVLSVSPDKMSSVRTIFDAGNNQLGIGVYGQGLLLYNESSKTAIPVLKQMAEASLQWNKDSLLIAADNLFWYDRVTNRCRQLKTGIDKRSHSAIINCLAHWKNGFVWVGTYDGAYLFHPLRSGSEQPAMQEQIILGNAGVKDILYWRGRTYFATDQGIFCKVDTSMHIRRISSGSNLPLPSVNANCMRVIRNTLWIGTTGNGILIYDVAGRLILQISRSNGLADNVVYSMAIRGNQLFVGTAAGLSIIDLPNAKIQSFTSQTYLPNAEFNRGACLVMDSIVYMGTINGVLKINVNRRPWQNLETTQPLAPTSLTLISQQGVSQDHTLAYTTPDKIIVPASTQSFSLGFSNALQDDEVLYYRLESDGIPSPFRRRTGITFAALRPDDYKLEVFRRGSNGLFKIAHTTVLLSVQPYFYQTFWFKVICLMAILFGAYLIIKYRERVLRKEQDLRTRIAGDLHDEIGSALTRIYLQTEGLIPATKSLEADVGNALQRISDSSRDALTSMNDIVWSVDAHFDNASELIARMRDYLARIREELDYTCRFECLEPKEKIYLRQAIRQNIYLIFREAVNNAIKYGRDRHFVVFLEFKAHFCNLKVQNYIPVSPNPFVSSTGNGLVSIRHRADKIKGNLQIVNDEYQFIIDLLVPVS